MKGQYILCILHCCIHLWLCCTRSRQPWIWWFKFLLQNHDSVRPSPSHWCFVQVPGQAAKECQCTNAQDPSPVYWHIILLVHGTTPFGPLQLQQLWRYVSWWVLCLCACKMQHFVLDLKFSRTVYYGGHHSTVMHSCPCPFGLTNDNF